LLGRLRAHLAQTLHGTPATKATPLSKKAAV
jgi:hypothetical protein